MAPIHATLRRRTPSRPGTAGSRFGRHPGYEPLMLMICSRHTYQPSRLPVLNYCGVLDGRPLSADLNLPLNAGICRQACKATRRSLCHTFHKADRCAVVSGAVQTHVSRVDGPQIDLRAHLAALRRFHL